MRMKLLTSIVNVKDVENCLWIRSLIAKYQWPFDYIMVKVVTNKSIGADKGHLIIFWEGGGGINYFLLLCIEAYVLYSMLCFLCFEFYALYNALIYASYLSSVFCIFLALYSLCSKHFICCNIFHPFCSLY